MMVEYMTGLFLEKEMILMRFLNKIINQISSAIQNVTDTAQESAISSEEISTSIAQTTIAVEQVNSSTQAQVILAGKLSDLVGRFRV